LASNPLPEEIMKKSFSVALVVAFLLSASFVRSQAAPPAAPTSPAPDASTTSVVPPDQQPTKEQLAKLFEVMRIREQTESMMKMFPAMIQQQIKQQEQESTANLPAGAKPTPEQQAALDKLQSRYFEKAMSLYTVDEMLGDMAGIYQRHFTREDVDAYIAFYTTPAGQHLLQMTPIIMQEYMPLVMQRVQDRSKDLTADFTKELNGVLNSTPPAATAPSTPTPK
jgi:hypothetical protein